MGVQCRGIIIEGLLGYCHAKRIDMGSEIGVKHVTNPEATKIRFSAFYKVTSLIQNEISIS